MLPKILQGSTILSPHPASYWHSSRTFFTGGSLNIQDQRSHFKASHLRDSSFRHSEHAESLLISYQWPSRAGSEWFLLVFSHALHLHCTKDKNVLDRDLCGRVSPVWFSSVWKILPKSNDTMNTRQGMRRNHLWPQAVHGLCCELLMAKELEDQWGRGDMVSTA